MRSQRDQPVAQLALESVHDRDDRDQRRDAEADAEHRDPADERDEETLPPGADIAQADEHGQRVEHRGLAARQSAQGYPAHRPICTRGRGSDRQGNTVNWNKELDRGN